MKIPRFLFLLFVLLIFFSAGGFWLTERLGLLEAFYLTVQTVWTVGFGDVAPKTVPGRVLAIFVVAIGSSLGIYLIGELIGFLASQTRFEELRKKKMQKRINQLQDHIILCGVGRVGGQAARQLWASQETFVAIDIRREAIVSLGKDVPHLVGDANEEEILLRAGIKKAKGLIAALPSDAENVFLTLTARGLNPTLEIVARAERPESVNKLKRAGASKVVSVAEIGGRRMALAVIRPMGISFVEQLFTSEPGPLKTEELILPSTFSSEETLSDLYFKQKNPVLILAIKRGADLLAPPSPEEVLKGGDVLLLAGSAAALNELRSRLRPDGQQ